MHNGKVVTKRPNGRPRVQTFFNTEIDPSRTHQEFKDECDVNQFIKKHKSINPTQFTQWFNSPPQSGVYADLTSLPSYEEALQTIILAQNSFEALPSELRQRFDNDPQKLINFLDDPKNEEESIKLKLRIKQEAPPPSAIEQTLNQIAKNTTPKKKTPPPIDED